MKTLSLVILALAAVNAGAADTVVINELLAHSHGKASDWIELYNTASSAIDLSGWYLSDSAKGGAVEKKYRIADGTVIEQGGYLVFKQYESFGRDGAPGCIKAFGLSEAGETVYLLSKDGICRDSATFAASPNGRGFGRFERSSAQGGFAFAPLAVPTPGSANAEPYVSPVVITEINYHPSEGADYEFVELKNRTDAPVTLVEMDVTTALSADKKIKEDLPWEIKGIGFTFPAGTVLQPGEVVVVAKNPALACYAGVKRVYGPFAGSLKDSGEQIELQIPGDLEYGEERYMIPVETILYSGATPWPVSANGAGDSLNRIDAGAYAGDYAGWKAARPTPGV